MYKQPLEIFIYFRVNVVFIKLQFYIYKNYGDVLANVKLS